jgi:rod shape determining protein RodA
MEKRLEKLDYILIFCVVVAVTCGIITLYTQEFNIMDGPGKWWRQLIYFFMGMIAMVLMTRINYQLLGSYALPIYLFSIALLVLTLIPGIGYLPLGRGARSWLKLGSIQIQTSEIAKLATVILLGQYLVIREREIKNISVLIIPFLIVILPMVLIILQPDFGTAVSFLPILFAILFLGGADILHIGSLITLGFISLAIPMYVEFTKITLTQPLIDQLVKINNSELVSLVNKVQGKIWLLLKNKSVVIGNIPIDPPSQKLMHVLQEAVDQVMEENTNFFFQIFMNETIMTGFGLILIFISLVLLIIRFARGRDQFRQYYISLGVLGLSIIFASLVIKYIPFRENQVIRLTAFINPDQFKQGAGYQLRASKPAIGSGRFLGKGLTYGEMTEGRVPHVPESSTDFIFASWAEQTGFVGSVFLVFILLAIPLRGLQVSFESKDKF